MGRSPNPALCSTIRCSACQPQPPGQERADSKRREQSDNGVPQPLKADSGHDGEIHAGAETDDRESQEPFG